MIIKGKVKRILFPKNGNYFLSIEYSIFKINSNGKEYSCKGETFPLYKGMDLEIEGELKKDPKWGDYILVKNIERFFENGDNKEDLYKNLIGEKTLEKLLLHYGNIESIILELENDGKDLVNVKGIGDKRRDKIVSKYKETFKLQKALDSLKGYGYNFNDVSKIVKSYKGDIENIKKEPHLLSLKGILNFKRCDEIVLKNKLSFQTSVRGVSAMIHVLGENKSNGDTYMEKDTFMTELKRVISVFENGWIVSEKKVKEIYELALKKNWIKENEGKIYYSKDYEEEVLLRKFLEKSLEEEFFGKTKIEDVLEIEKEIGTTFDKVQRESILKSMNNKLTVITGGPGTGKTTILNAIVRLSLKNINKEDISLCSPTGKASVRMSESTGLQAKTIHSYLKVVPENERSFFYNENNKLQESLVIVDESSMLEQSLAASLIRALKDNVRVLFVGDIDQLPPVGAGYFLRDLIESLSEKQVSVLKKTYRQESDSSIISLSKKVREKSLKESDLERKKDFLFIENGDNKETITKVFMSSYKKVGLEGTVVITPQNKSDIGTRSLNNELHEVVNPKKGEEMVKNGYKFRVGSKIIITKNNNKIGIFNGQMGYIEEINLEEKMVKVRIDNVEYELFGDDVENIALGYVITAHKSQGSEWKNVIIIASEKHFNNSRKLIYTAITRAKENLVILGQKSAVVNSQFKKERDPKSRILNNYR